MPSATDHPAAADRARHGDRTRRLTAVSRPALAALLGVVALALAGPAMAATHAGGPSPDPSQSATGSGGPSPDPFPQATGSGGVIQGASSQGSASSGSGTTSPSIPVQVPNIAPQVSQPRASTTPAGGSTTRGAERTSTSTTVRAATSRRAAHAASRSRSHGTARQTAAQREAAFAYGQLRHRLALESRTAGPISAAATLTSAGPRSDGVLLLIGAGVLLGLAAAGGVLLRKLWRLHGEWYGGRPA